MGFCTDAIHAGQEPDPATGAIVTPIYQTSTYVQQGPGEHKGFEYARTQHPTRLALERNLAALEGGTRGFAFSSGMAAIAAVASLLKQGDHVIVTENVYGGTYRFFEKVMTRYGLTFTYVDTSVVENIQQVARDNTQMVFIETPSNPLLILSDLAAISDFCRSRRLLHVVDNTFLSPYYQRPLALGADIVLHSTTKYINGHSDMVGGVVVVRDEGLAERLAFIQNAVGAVPGPLDCWLVLRSTKTLALRMRQHNANAMAVAKFLASHPEVQKVYHPGLEDHPQHELALRQQVSPYGEVGFGGMISFDVGSLQRAVRLLKSVKLWALAESLGGVESLISHPATMTHATVPKAQREKFGLTDGLIRLSVGLEDVEDLIADLERGLQAIVGMVS